MHKFLLALMMVFFMIGCAATSGGGSNSGALPEIAPYDEPAYEPLPAMVPAS